MIQIQKSNFMKSFKKFIFITLLPLFLIAIFAYLKTWSFEDFRYPHVNFYLFVFFSIISFCYVYIFEKLFVKKSKPLKIYGISITSVFLITLFFSFIYIYFLFETTNYYTIFFQSTLAVSLFLLIVFVFEIYKKSLQKEVITFHEKPYYYVGLILKTIFILSFLLFIMVCGPLINQVPLNEFVVMTSRVFICSFQVAVISFTILTLFYRIVYFRKNVAIGVLLASVISCIANMFLDTLFSKILLAQSIIFFLICLFSCALIVIMLLYKNKIQSLSFSFSKKESEYLQLKNQINPHFLFNNLNTLIAFIEINPQKAVEFGQHLSNVYRHYLKVENDDFVKLANEMDFIKEYTAVFKAKFENGFTFEVKNEATTNQYILSLSLQELIDNIFKHNILDPETPIVIEILIQKSELIIRNTKHTKEALNSTKKGIENINKRYKLLAKKEISITDSNDFFEVKIPILHLSI